MKEPIRTGQWDSRMSGLDVAHLFKQQPSQKRIEREVPTAQDQG